MKVKILIFCQPVCYPYLSLIRGYDWIHLDNQLLHSLCMFDLLNFNFGFKQILNCVESFQEQATCKWMVQLSSLYYLIIYTCNSVLSF